MISEHSGVQLQNNHSLRYVLAIGVSLFSSNIDPAIPLILIFRAWSQRYTRIVIVHKMIDNLTEPPPPPTLRRSDRQTNVGL